MSIRRVNGRIVWPVLLLLLSGCDDEPISTSYFVTELGSVPTASPFSVRDINNVGQLVGDVPTRAVILDKGEFRMLPLPIDARAATPSSINNAGVVGGSFYSWNNYFYHPVLWVNGQPQVQPELPDSVQSYLWSVNDAGNAVGFSDTYAGVRAVLWQDGTVEDLGGTPSLPECGAYGINSDSQVVGGCSLTGTDISRAFLWKEGTMTELPHSSSYDRAFAHAINDAGVIVGYVSSADGSSSRGAVWRDGKLQLLAAPDGEITGIAWDINSSEQAVGQAGSRHPFEGDRAVIWEGTSMLYLDELIDLEDPAAGHLRLSSFPKINDLGQIIVEGIDLREPRGGRRSYLLTPSKTPSGPARFRRLGG